MFPEHFEPIVSRQTKHRIAEVFAQVDGVREAPNIDLKLAATRAALSSVLGSGFSFYDSPLRSVWGGPEPAAWREFVRWASQLYRQPDFDEQERDYKLEIAERMGAARASLDDEDWLRELRQAFGPPQLPAPLRA